MTLNSLVNRIDYDPDGVQTEFTYNFLINDADDVFIYADGDVYSEPWTISGLGDAAGGTLTFDDPPLASITELTILRSLALTQNASYPEFSAFPAKSHERALDELTMMIQQQQEILDRSITGPVNTDPVLDPTLPPYDAGKALMYDETDKKMTTSDDNVNDILSGSIAARDIAVASAVVAEDSATAAGDSETAALSSEELAEKWASELEDVPVVGTDYSAFHWAKKAEDWVIGGSPNSSVRQTMLTGPDLEATPDTVETSATKTGDLRSTYHDLGMDMLTGSRGGMTLTKPTGVGSNYIGASLFEAGDYLKTEATSILSTAISQLTQQRTASGVQFGTSAILNSANLFAFMTNRDEIIDGNRWQWNDESGFFMCSYAGTGVARELQHPMGIEPMFATAKRTDVANSWPTTRYGTSSNMYLDFTTVEQDDNIFGISTDTYIAIEGISAIINVAGGDYVMFGWAGEPLDDIMVGMRGKRGVTAHWIYPAGSGALTVDTGITGDIQMIKYKSLTSGDWKVLNRASGFSNFTILNDTDAETAQAEVTVSGSEVTFIGGAVDIMFTVIGSTVDAPDNKRKEGTKVLRKVGTGATGHRVDLGADFSSGTNGGMVFGRITDTIARNTIVDTIQGAGVNLRTDEPDALATDATVVEAFLSTGMQLGTDVKFNGAELCQYIAFNTTHKITTVDGLEWQYNPLTGFAMCKYIGDDSVGRTLTHPMGKKLRMGWFKELATTNAWVVFIDSLGATGSMKLNDTDAFTVLSSVFNDTEPDDTTITVGSNGRVNRDASEYIFYGWFGDDLSAELPGVTGERGVSAFFQYVGGSGAMSMDTGIENITGILYKPSSILNGWQFVNLTTKNYYFLDSTNVEGLQPAFSVEGSVLSFAGNANTAEFIVFGSKADSGVDNDVIFPASSGDPAIVSMANGFEAYGNRDIIKDLIVSQTLNITGAEGQKFIYVDADGNLDWTDTRPEYLRDYTPYAKGNYVYDIDRAVMVDDTGVDDPLTFIGECWLDNLGNVYDIRTYARGDVWVVGDWTFTAESYVYFDNPFGHVEIHCKPMSSTSPVNLQNQYTNAAGNIVGLNVAWDPDTISSYNWKAPIGASTDMRIIARRNF